MSSAAVIYVSSAMRSRSVFYVALGLAAAYLASRGAARYFKRKLLTTDDFTEEQYYSRDDHD
jgi:hypothetical protein